MKCFTAAAVVALLSHSGAAAFVVPSVPVLVASEGTTRFAATHVNNISNDTVKECKELERERLKQELLGRLGGPSLISSSSDPVLADPLTKEPLIMSLKGPILRGGTPLSGISLTLRSSVDSDRVFEGRTTTYINLLEPASTSTLPSESGEDKTSVSSSPILSFLLALTPPPLRSIIANATHYSDDESIPMRDLFTSPSVSFSYERGWRQGFSSAGLPGADKEFEMANEYFAPIIEKKRESSVLVDMSCATGLFTRRFTKNNIYSRVIACDYSDSMLSEARRRIRSDSEIASSSTKLDLVRCDVANIPMKTGSIDAFHAGAAMHCWPEIEASLKEIHRVLVPGGRYFATTFLGTFLGGFWGNYLEYVAKAEGTASGGADMGPSVQAFQYYPSEEYLTDLLVGAGFDEEKVNVEVVGRGGVIIRCEK